MVKAMEGMGMGEAAGAGGAGVWLSIPSPHRRILEGLQPRRSQERQEQSHR
jgi:hypothetical protein